MADPRESFGVLEDFTTKEGMVLTKVAQGDALASKNAAAVLGFKDAAGNLRYPKVDTQDRLLTNSDVGDTACLSARGEHAAGSATFVDVTGSTITLLPDLTYEDIGFVVSCRQAAHFQIVQTDDATDNILADVILEPGMSSLAAQLHCLSFVAGSTGTQTLKLKAKNFNALPLSALRGTLTVTEIQP